MKKWFSIFFILLFSIQLLFVASSSALDPVYPDLPLSSFKIDPKCQPSFLVREGFRNGRENLRVYNGQTGEFLFVVYPDGETRKAKQARLIMDKARALQLA